jgi:hypothetical protein
MAKSAGGNLGAMATRAQVVQLLAHGHSHQSAARALGIPAGQAYMIATGRPADGNEPGLQWLVNPPAHNPTHEDDTMAWVRLRAARDLSARTDGTS